MEEALVCDEAASHALLDVTRGGWEENASSLHGTYQSKSTLVICSIPEDTLIIYITDLLTYIN